MRQPKEIMIGDKTLEEILINHMHWVNDKRKGRKLYIIINMKVR